MHNYPTPLPRDLELTRDLSSINDVAIELTRRLTLAEILGHSLPTWLNDIEAFERFMTHIVCHVPTRCWVWSGAAVNRYGHSQVRLAGKNRGGHRLAYEWLVGPIPPDLVIDHLCRNRACVNPAHLEAVSNDINILRGIGKPALNARATHCPQGHPYDEGNTIILANESGRRCRTCSEAYYRLNQARMRSQRNAAYAARKKIEGQEVLPPPANRTHCKRGHEYTPENTRVTSQGYRQCRACARIVDQARYANDPARRASAKQRAAESKARHKQSPQQ